MKCHRSHTMRPRFSKRLAAVITLLCSTTSIHNEVLSAPTSIEDMVIAQNNTAILKKTDTIGIKEFRDLRDVTALNICYSLAQKIDYNQSSSSALSALLNIIKKRYKSQITGMPQSAQTSKGLRDWVAGNLLVQTSLVCPKLIPPKELQTAKKIRATVQKSRTNQ